MKRKSAPSKKRPRSARPDPSAGLRTGPSTRLGMETEMPLDAEDVALASLEAKVRAEEAQPKLGQAEAPSGLTVRLPRAMILQLRAQAAERNVTPSRLVELALAQYLRPQKPERGRR